MHFCLAFVEKSKKKSLQKYFRETLEFRGFQSVSGCFRGATGDLWCTPRVQGMSTKFQRSSEAFQGLSRRCRMLQSLPGGLRRYEGGYRKYSGALKAVSGRFRVFRIFRGAPVGSWGLQGCFRGVTGSIRGTSKGLRGALTVSGNLNSVSGSPIGFQGVLVVSATVLELFFNCYYCVF